MSSGLSDSSSKSDLLGSSSLTPKTLLTLYDNTRISEFKTCARKYYYRHVRHWTPEQKKIPLIFGSCWHAAMDVIWANAKELGRLWKEPASRKVIDARHEIVDKAYQAFILEWLKNGMNHPDNMSPDDFDDLAPRTPLIAYEMLAHYGEARASLFSHDSFELLDIERPFAVPLDPNDPTLFYVGRLDKVFRSHGEIRVGEHKCLGEGTPVIKYDGSVCPVENIYNGDLLASPDGTPRKVVMTYSGRELLYRITPMNGDSYVVNQSHILSLKMASNLGSTKRINKKDGRAAETPRRLYCGNRAFGSGEVANVKLLEYLNAGIGFKESSFGWHSGTDFSSKELDPDLPPYILGLWLGDGTSKEASLAIANEDVEILREFKEYAAARSVSVHSRSTGSSKCNLYMITTGISGYPGQGKNPLINALRRYGLLQEKKSNIPTKHIPLVYKASSRKDRLELLAGILDSDGNLPRKNSGQGYKINQKNPILSQDIVFLARSLGFCVTVKKGPSGGSVAGRNNEYFHMYIAGDISTIPCRLPRKQAIKRKPRYNPDLTTIKIEPLGIGPYYGFELQGPDGLFLLGDFTVTHNTSTAYKKGGPFRNDFIDSFSPSSQIDGYLFAGRREYGPKFTSVWVDASLVHRTEHSGFRFIPIERQHAQIDAWLWETHYWIDQILGNKAALEERRDDSTPYLAAFPKNTASCGNYGGCPYQDLCKTIANPEKQKSPPLGYKKEVWSPFSEIKLEKLGFTTTNTGEPMPTDDEILHEDE